MIPRVRWFVLIVVLAVAAVIALWPRGPVTPAQGTGTVSREQPEGDLGPAQAKAQLPPCPQPGPTDELVPALAQVRVMCLGQNGVLNLGHALAGKTTLVNLWATWCTPCRDELPVLAEYATGKDAVPVLAVQVHNDSRLGGLELLASLNVRLPAVADSEGTAQAALKPPPVLPASFLVRPDGQIRRITEPLLFTSAEQVRKAVADNLGGT